MEQNGKEEDNPNEATPVKGLELFNLPLESGESIVYDQTNLELRRFNREESNSEIETATPDAIVIAKDGPSLLTRNTTRPILVLVCSEERVVCFADFFDDPLSHKTDSDFSVIIDMFLQHYPQTEGKLFFNDQTKDIALQDWFEEVQLWLKTRVNKLNIVNAQKVSSLSVNTKSGNLEVNYTASGQKKDETGALWQVIEREPLDPKYDRFFQELFVNQEMQERVRLVLKLLKQNPDSSTNRETVAYHGTSIEALITLIQKGVMSGRTIEATNRVVTHEANCVYVYPTAAASESFLSEAENKVGRTLDRASEEGIIGYAEGYGELVGQAHLLARLLGISLSESNYIVIDNLSTLEDSSDIDFETLEAIEPLGITREKLAAALKEMKRARGFLIGLKTEVLTDFDVSLGDDWPEDDRVGKPSSPATDSATHFDLKIKVGEEGLPLEYISGIRALGPLEKEFIARLESAVG